MVVFRAKQDSERLQLVSLPSLGIWRQSRPHSSLFKYFVDKCLQPVHGIQLVFDG